MLILLNQDATLFDKRINEFGCRVSCCRSGRRGLRPAFHAYG